MAPVSIATTSPAASVGVSLSSAIRIRQPPAGALPATAMSPPSDTSTPPPPGGPPIAAWAAAAARSDARPLPVEPRSSSTPRLARTSRRTGSRVDGLPTGDRLEPDLDRPSDAADPVEIGVVPDGPHRPADRRVDGSAGVAGRPEGDGDRVGEERADDDGRAGPRVQGDDLAVVAEPAVGTVDPVEDVLDRGARRRQIAVEDDEADTGPDGPPVGGQGLGHRPAAARSAVCAVDRVAARGSITRIRSRRGRSRLRRSERPSPGRQSTCRWSSPRSRWASRRRTSLSWSWS